MHTNPYVAGPPVRAPHFYGRARLLSELTDPRYTCYYLVGIRRVGKTSLLQTLAGSAPPDVVPLFVNLQRAVGRGSRLDPQRFNRVLLQTAKRDGRGRLDLGEVQAAGELVERVEALAWTAEDAGLTVWLLWDETELLADLPQDALMRLRSVLQECPSLRTVLAASKGLGGLNDRTRDWQVSPFLFGFATRFIPLLSEETARALIEQRDHPDGPVDVPAKATATLLEACGGHPYLLQALCLRLYRSERRRLRVPTRRDLDRAFSEEALGAVFQQDYDNLSPGERAVLNRLAQGEADEEELARRAVLPVEGVHSLLVALAQVGMVQQVNGGYKQGYELLGRWLQSGMVQEREARLSDQASVEVVNQAEAGEASPVMLAQLLARRLDDEELRALCFELDVDYDSLRGEGKAAKARELVAHLRRQEALPRLVEWLETHRPDIDMLKSSQSGGDFARQ
jgi:hypothetical protein